MRCRSWSFSPGSQKQSEWLASKNMKLHKARLDTKLGQCLQKLRRKVPDAYTDNKVEYERLVDEEAAQCQAGDQQLCRELMALGGSAKERRQYVTKGQGTTAVKLKNKSGKRRKTLPE